MSFIFYIFSSLIVSICVYCSVDILDQLSNFIRFQTLPFYIRIHHIMSMVHGHDIGLDSVVRRP